MFGIEAVAMVTLNALAIIVYLKKRSLRKRSMFLAINQAVAVMFVGSYVILACWLLGGYCDFWSINSLVSHFGCFAFLSITSFL